MEPDGLNELKAYLYNKFQKYDDSDTNDELVGYLDSLVKAGSLTGSGHGSPHYWQEHIEVQQYTSVDYTEEIEDKDLGIVRKINLN